MATIEKPWSFITETCQYFFNLGQLHQCVLTGSNLDDLIIRIYKGERDCLGVPLNLPGYESKKCRGASGVLEEVDNQLKKTSSDRAKILIPQNNPEKPYQVMWINRR